MSGFKKLRHSCHSQTDFKWKRRHHPEMNQHFSQTDPGSPALNVADGKLIPIRKFIRCVIGLQCRLHFLLHGCGQWEELVRLWTAPQLRISLCIVCSCAMLHFVLKPHRVLQKRLGPIGSPPARPHLADKNPPPKKLFHSEALKFCEDAPLAGRNRERWP